MKKSTLLIFLSILIITGLGILVISLTSGHDIEKTESERPLVLAMTASVEIPESMEFAGERIAFDRYDKRERMDRELNSFTYFHSTTMLLFKRANRFFPIIEPILTQQGVPDDLKYLAVIESSLDPRAVSPARAVGLWQFLQETGKQYGLEATTNVDERYHVEKSTVAACRYLKDAYQRLGSWSAAALAYNGGQGRITAGLKEQGVDDSLDLWLVEETSRYYYRMLAMKQIFENPQQYGFIIKAEHLYKPMQFKEVKVSTSIPDLVAFAKQHNITYAQLKDFNSWLRGTSLNNTSGKTYTLLIPTQDDLYYKKGENPKVHNTAWVVK
ncbi:lytic transglycosylase domain-containing protein [Proteiniphilum sp.]|uniref:lytic transglycosylase domain-containing protein n=1 Tax=Proteiniphilum sp. TaxID=1926877 RepID=UPI002B2076FC|nr:transglycosylase SLT domain-containing protein [Proteiniphilum sp.]MEA4918471.1 transglycosylase SLT domain-containing protein [Proteiniphilum sp.]